MANLIGYLKDEHKSNATRVSRTSSTNISAQLETWQGSIRTELDRDGEYRVLIGGKDSPNIVVARGNVGNDPVLGRHAIGPDGKVYAPNSRGALVKLTATLRFPKNTEGA